MSFPFRRLVGLAAFAAALAAPALAHEGFRSEERTVIDLAAEASLPAANDLAFASLYVERSGSDPAALAEEINRTIAAALATGREQREVKVQSEGTGTWPIYGKDGGRIEGWRMRSAIHLESRDLKAMSELIGRLQGQLAVGHIGLQPSPDTRRKVADDAMVAAMRNFEQRAGVIAGALGKRYRLRQLSVSDAGVPPPIYPRMRSAPAMMAEAAPAPLEAGESRVTVNINGSIELID